MILDADSSASKQVGYGRDRFTAALGAGTNGENKVTEGKLLWLAEDLRVLFHCLRPYDSKVSANVQSTSILHGDFWSVAQAIVHVE